MTILAAILLLAGEPDDELAALLRTRAEARQSTHEAKELLRDAHEALDRGDYDGAASLHRRSHDAALRSAELRRRDGDEVRALARALFAGLDDDAVEVRDRAQRQLVRLGPSAIPVLEGARNDRSAEALYRIDAALERLRRMEMDADGRLHQWAATAVASSEYSDTNWSAMQATGKPDTFAAGDSRTAWASLTADGGPEWLELGYENAVVPTRVRVHENYNPGAVCKIEARDAKGEWRILWEGRDPIREGIGWFEVDVTPGFATRTIRVTLDSANVPGWNEIDAVELVGEP